MHGKKRPPERDAGGLGFSSGWQKGGKGSIAPTSTSMGLGFHVLSHSAMERQVRRVHALKF